MKEFPMKHLCTCSPEENWAHTTLYERTIKTKTSPIIEVSSAEEADELLKALNNGEIALDETPYIYESYFPVLVCEGCDKEVMIEKNNWYSNWVREGEHFINDLHILLESLAYYMHLADKDGTLEFKGTTFSNTMEKLE